jgi:hypothetical protein
MFYLPTSGCDLDATSLFFVRQSEMVSTLLVSLRDRVAQSPASTVPSSSTSTRQVLQYIHYRNVLGGGGIMLDFPGIFRSFVKSIFLDSWEYHHTLTWCGPFSVRIGNLHGH